MMNSDKRAARLLIKTLTQTHQNAASAYRLAISQAGAPEVAALIARIADALRVQL